MRRCVVLARANRRRRTAGRAVTNPLHTSHTVITPNDITNNNSSAPHESSSNNNNKNHNSSNDKRSAAVAAATATTGIVGNVAIAKDEKPPFFASKANDNTSFNINYSKNTKSGLRSSSNGGGERRNHSRQQLQQQQQRQNRSRGEDDNNNIGRKRTERTSSKYHNNAARDAIEREMTGAISTGEDGATVHFPSKNKTGAAGSDGSGLHHGHGNRTRSSNTQKNNKTDSNNNAQYSNNNNNNHTNQSDRAGGDRGKRAFTRRWRSDNTTDRHPNNNFPNNQKQQHQQRQQKERQQTGSHNTLNSNHNSATSAHMMDQQTGNRHNNIKDNNSNNNNVGRDRFSRGGANTRREGGFERGTGGTDAVVGGRIPPRRGSPPGAGGTTAVSSSDVSASTKMTKMMPPLTTLRAQGSSPTRLRELLLTTHVTLRKNYLNLGKNERVYHSFCEHCAVALYESGLVEKFASAAAATGGGDPHNVTNTNAQGKIGGGATTEEEESKTAAPEIVKLVVFLGEEPPTDEMANEVAVCAAASTDVSPAASQPDTSSIFDETLPTDDATTTNSSDGSSSNCNSKSSSGGAPNPHTPRSYFTISLTPEAFEFLSTPITAPRIPRGRLLCPPWMWEEPGEAEATATREVAEKKEGQSGEATQLSAASTEADMPTSTGRHSTHFDRLYTDSKSAALPSPSQVWRDAWKAEEEGEVPSLDSTGCPASSYYSQLEAGMAALEKCLGLAPSIAREEKEVARAAKRKHTGDSSISSGGGGMLDVMRLLQTLFYFKWIKEERRAQDSLQAFYDKHMESESESSAQKGMKKGGGGETRDEAGGGSSLTPDAAAKSNDGRTVDADDDKNNDLGACLHELRRGVIEHLATSPAVAARDTGADATTRASAAAAEVKRRWRLKQRINSSKEAVLAAAVSRVDEFLPISPATASETSAVSSSSSPSSSSYSPSPSPPPPSSSPGAAAASPDCYAVHVMDLLYHLLFRYALWRWQDIPNEVDRAAFFRLGCLPWYLSNHHGASAFHSSSSRALLRLHTSSSNRFRRRLSGGGNHSSSSSSTQHLVNTTTAAAPLSVALAEWQTYFSLYDASRALQADQQSHVRYLRMLCWPTPLDTKSQLVLKTLAIPSTAPTTTTHHISKEADSNEDGSTTTLSFDLPPLAPDAFGIATLKDLVATAASTEKTQRASYELLYLFFHHLQELQRRATAFADSRKGAGDGNMATGSSNSRNKSESTLLRDGSREAAVAAAGSFSAAANPRFLHNTKALSNLCILTFDSDVFMSERFFRSTFARGDWVLLPTAGDDLPALARDAVVVAAAGGMMKGVGGSSLGSHTSEGNADTSSSTTVKTPALVALPALEGLRSHASVERRAPFAVTRAVLAALGAGPLSRVWSDMSGGRAALLWESLARCWAPLLRDGTALFALPPSLSSSTPSRSSRRRRHSHKRQDQHRQQQDEHERQPAEQQQPQLAEGSMSSGPMTEAERETEAVVRILRAQQAWAHTGPLRALFTAGAPPSDDSVGTDAPSAAPASVKLLSLAWQHLTASVQALANSQLQQCHHTYKKREAAAAEEEEELTRLRAAVSELLEWGSLAAALLEAEHSLATTAAAAASGVGDRSDNGISEETAKRLKSVDKDEESCLNSSSNDDDNEANDTYEERMEAFATRQREARALFSAALQSILLEWSRAGGREPSNNGAETEEDLAQLLTGSSYDTTTTDNSSEGERISRMRAQLAAATFLYQQWPSPPEVVSARSPSVAHFFASATEGNATAAESRSSIVVGHGGQTNSKPSAIATGLQCFGRLLTSAVFPAEDRKTLQRWMKRQRAAIAASERLLRQTASTSASSPALDTSTCMTDAGNKTSEAGKRSGAPNEKGDEGALSSQQARQTPPTHQCTNPTLASWHRLMQREDLGCGPVHLPIPVLYQTLKGLLPTPPLPSATSTAASSSSPPPPPLPLLSVQDISVILRALSGSQMRSGVTAAAVNVFSSNSNSSSSKQNIFHTISIVMLSTTSESVSGQNTGSNKKSSLQDGRRQRSNSSNSGSTQQQQQQEQRGGDRGGGGREAENTQHSGDNISVEETNASAPPPSIADTVAAMEDGLRRYVRQYLPLLPLSAVLDALLVGAVSLPEVAAGAAAAATAREAEENNSSDADTGKIEEGVGTDENAEETQVTAAAGSWLTELRQLLVPPVAARAAALRRERSRLRRLQMDGDDEGDGADDTFEEEEEGDADSDEDEGGIGEEEELGTSGGEAEGELAIGDRGKASATDSAAVFESPPNFPCHTQVVAMMVVYMYGEFLTLRHHSADGLPPIPPSFSPRSSRASSGERLVSPSSLVTAAEASGELLRQVLAAVVKCLVLEAAAAAAAETSHVVDDQNTRTKAPPPPTEEEVKEGEVGKAAEKNTSARETAQGKDKTSTTLPSASFSTAPRVRDRPPLVRSSISILKAHTIAQYMALLSHHEDLYPAAQEEVEMTMTVGVAKTGESFLSGESFDSEKENIGKTTEADTTKRTQADRNALDHTQRIAELENEEEGEEVEENSDASQLSKQQQHQHQYARTLHPTQDDAFPVRDMLLLGGLFLFYFPDAARAAAALADRGASADLFVWLTGVCDTVARAYVTRGDTSDAAATMLDTRQTYMENAAQKREASGGEGPFSRVNSATAAAVLPPSTALRSATIAVLASFRHRSLPGAGPAVPQPPGTPLSSSTVLCRALRREAGRLSLLALAASEEGGAVDLATEATGGPLAAPNVWRAHAVTNEEDDEESAGAVAGEVGELARAVASLRDWAAWCYAQALPGLSKDVRHAVSGGFPRWEIVGAVLAAARALMEAPWQPRADTHAYRSLLAAMPLLTDALARAAAAMNDRSKMARGSRRFLAAAAAGASPASVSAALPVSRRVRERGARASPREARDCVVAMAAVVRAAAAEEWRDTPAGKALPPRVASVATSGGKRNTRGDGGQTEKIGAASRPTAEMVAGVPLYEAVSQPPSARDAPLSLRMTWKAMTERVVSLAAAAEATGRVAQGTSLPSTAAQTSTSAEDEGRHRQNTAAAQVSSNSSASDSAERAELATALVAALDSGAVLGCAHSRVYDTCLAVLLYGGNHDSATVNNDVPLVSDTLLSDSSSSSRLPLSSPSLSPPPPPLVESLDLGMWAVLLRALAAPGSGAEARTRTEREAAVMPFVEALLTRLESGGRHSVCAARRSSSARGGGSDTRDCNTTHTNTNAVDSIATPETHAADRCPVVSVKFCESLSDFVEALGDFASHQPEGFWRRLRRALDTQAQRLAEAAVSGVSPSSSSSSSSSFLLSSPTAHRLSGSEGEGETSRDTANSAEGLVEYWREQWGRSFNHAVLTAGHHRLARPEWRRAPGAAQRGKTPSANAGADADGNSADGAASGGEKESNLCEESATEIRCEKTEVSAASSTSPSSPSSPWSGGADTDGKNPHYAASVSSVVSANDVVLVRSAVSRVRGEARRRRTMRTLTHSSSSSAVFPTSSSPSPGGKTSSDKPFGVRTKDGTIRI